MENQDSTAHPTLAFPMKPKLVALGFSSQNFSLHTSFSSTDNNKNTDVKDQKKNGRERLKRHREEVAGEVRIPEKWSQENFLMDWMDHSSFDKLLAPKGIGSAREALMAEARRASSQGLTIEIN